MKRNLIFLLLILTSFQLSPVSFTPKDGYIAAAALSVGSVATYIYSTYHHPAALEKRKLEYSIAQQQKKELLEAQEKQRKEKHAYEAKIAQEKLEKEKENTRIWHEQQRNNAHKLLADVEHVYQSEIQLLADNKLLTQPQSFIEIIKSKYKILPFSCYEQGVLHDLKCLKTIDPAYLPDEQKREKHKELIHTLENIIKTHNLKMADLQKAEQHEDEQTKKAQQAEWRTIEKEKLELEKLRNETHLSQLKIKHVSQNTRNIEQILYRIDTMNNRSTIDAKTNETQYKHSIILLEGINSKQKELCQENKELLKKVTGTETHLTKLLNEIKKLFIAKNTTQTPTATATANSYPTPSINPELLQGWTTAPSAPAPSAPPL